MNERTIRTLLLPVLVAIGLWLAALPRAATAAGSAGTSAAMPGFVVHARVGPAITGACRRVAPAPDAGAATPAGRRNRLDPIAPNPFRPETRIRFSVDARTRVALQVFDVKGRLVRTLLRGTAAPGTMHDVRWDGRDERGRPVSAGAYFCRLQGAGFSLTRKVIYLP